MLGNKAAFGEGGGQLRVFRHVAEVAKQAEAKCDPGHRTVDCGKDRLRHGEKVAEFLLEVAPLLPFAPTMERGVSPADTRLKRDISAPAQKPQVTLILALPGRRLATHAI